MDLKPTGRPRTRSLFLRVLFLWVFLFIGAAVFLDPAGDARSSGFTSLSEPESLAVDPSGRWIYAGFFSGADILSFAVSGRRVGPSPMSRTRSGWNPFSTAVDPSGTALYSNNEFANTLTRYEPGNGYLAPTPIQSVPTGH